MSEPDQGPSKGDASREPFYVGYLPVPRPIRRWIVSAVAAAAALAVGTAILVASQQSDPGGGVWNTQEVARLSGRLLVDPYAVVVVSADEAGDSARSSTVLLVSMLKQGATERARSLGLRSGQPVEVRGYAIERDGQRMLELLDGEDAMVASASGTEEAPGFEDLGRAELVGQIIDPKCYFGVMKPGVGKIHRACAVRCIDGGIPPVLMTLHADGPPSYYVVTDAASNAANQAVLPHVAETIRVEGRVQRRAGTLYLRAELESVERLE